MGTLFNERLLELMRYPRVGDVRGLGLMSAVELVADPKTKQPFGADKPVGSFVRDWCYRNGMILRNNHDILVFAPALIVTEAQIDEIVGILDGALAAAVEHFHL